MNKHTPACSVHPDKEATYGGLEKYLREMSGRNLQINTWYGAIGNTDKHKSPESVPVVFSLQYFTL